MNKKQRKAIVRNINVVAWPDEVWFDGDGYTLTTDSGDYPLGSMRDVIEWADEMFGDADSVPDWLSMTNEVQQS